MCSSTGWVLILRRRAASWPSGRSPRSHYVSHLDVFPVVSRKILTLRAWKLNLIAAVTETAILGSAAFLCWRFRGRRGA